MDNNYLPSKQFISRVATLAVILLLAFCIYRIFIFFKHRSGESGTTALIIKPDVIQKDSNNNGIPDWEESLWGLDPFGDGSSNKEFILAKRETLAKENNLNPDTNQPLSENETLSREFFSIIMSLQQSGNLDDSSIQSVGDTIGEKITATPIADVYTKATVLEVKNNPANINTYHNALSSLMNRYVDKEIGKELTFISVGLSTNDPGAFKEALSVASLYKSFGKELMRIQVPSTLSGAHLSLANNYEKVGQSVEGMSVMLEDPIIGMKAIVNYNKYTDALVSDIDTLSKALQ
jgi:hypothetical protein